MKKLFFLLLIIFTVNTQAQLESFTDKTVGNGADYTNEPTYAQSEYSHSQTIYYADDLQFKGTINEIRFFTVFSSTSRTNVGNLVVRMALTNKTEFATGEPFVDVATMTEVHSGGVDISVREHIITLTTPFYYDGTQNLLLDVQDMDPGYSSSATDGWVGVENFGNPPTRTKMTFTHQGTTTGVYENSYAKTKFIGDLERCPTQYTFTNDVYNDTEASFIISNPNSINGFRYKYALYGDSAPSTYQVVSGDFTITGLIPGKLYELYYKSDCSQLPSRYFTKRFKTKPAALTVPSTIDFETETHNYFLSDNYGGTAHIASEAGLTGSTQGLLMQGSGNHRVYSQWSNYHIWRNNDNFISTALFVIDLASNPTHPVFEFDLQQTAYVETYLRYKINGIVQDYVYNAQDITADTPRRISIDLSDYIGQKIELELEHLGKSDLQKSYIDNIQLKEATCLLPDNIVTTATENSITLDWNSVATEWEIAYQLHDENFDNTGIQITSNPYTINGLTTATPYNIYLRSKCGSDISPWVKIYKSTIPELIQIPYENPFSTSVDLASPTFTLNYNKYADIHNSYNDTDIFLDQKEHTKGWIGGVTTTETQAWNDNKDFVSSMSFRVDATHATTLTADISFKQNYYYSTQTSWFRILINGQQFGSSYNPTTRDRDPSQHAILDLTAYVGDVVNITLEQCGHHKGRNWYNSSGDNTIIAYVSFTGNVTGINNNTFKGISIYPNPTTNYLQILSENELKNISIYDVNGKILLEQNISINHIDVSKLSKGLYFARLISKKGSSIYLKFVKK